ncbi:MAG: GntR family transcriptional regulator [Actinomycetota bacterium]|nr:GntR family transcriptional regulator [Actinomycetota bacterium]
MNTRAQSRSVRAYDEVRRLIIEGTLQPGDRMNVRLLCERLGVSSTPVKAALAALARDGLVRSRTNRGYFVTVLGEQDVRELFELREALEPFAVRRAVGDGAAAAALDELRGLTEAQRDAADAADLAGYNDLNLRFHQMLWQLAGNRRLTQLMDNIVGQMSLVTTFTSRAPGRLEHAIAEHTAIVQMCADRQLEELGELVARHVRDSYAAYLRMVTWTS